MTSMVSNGGTIAAAFLCWIPLILTVGGLLVAFYITNAKAFSRNLPFGGKEYTGGAFKPENAKKWRWR